MSSRRFKSWGLALHRVKGAAPFQEGHDRKNFVQVLFGEFGHKTTPAGLEHHQAFTVQDLQGFP